METTVDARDGRTLVTGAAGLAGSAVIREFARTGTQVRALARDRVTPTPFADFARRPAGAFLGEATHVGL